MIIISKPSPIMSSRSGQASFNSSYRYAGLKFAKRFNAFLNLSNPASGLKFGESLYHGEVLVLPPMEPINTASDAFAASIASSVNGTPVASMEHPPIKISSYSNSCPNSLPTLSNTFFASFTISGPIPSPEMTPTRNFIAVLPPVPF